MEYNRIYQNLNHNDAAALNESIMDAGITSFPELEAAWNQATKFLTEQEPRKLSFPEFQASKRAVSASLEWCDSNGLEFPCEVLIYEDECFIECRSGGHFQLIIECSEWFSNDLESLERILYDRWFI